MDIINNALYHVTSMHPKFFDKEHRATLPGTSIVSATFGNTFLEPRYCRVEDNGKEGHLLFAAADLAALVKTGMLFKTPDVFATRFEDNEGQIFVDDFDGGLNRFVTALDHLGAIITIPNSQNYKFEQEKDIKGNPIDKYTSTERIPLEACEVEDVNLLALANQHDFVTYIAPKGRDEFSRISGFRFGIGEHIKNEHVNRALDGGALTRVSMEDLMLKKASVL
jgi:hypothetical protein